jgi:hypothetical protein
VVGVLVDVHVVDIVAGVAAEGAVAGLAGVGAELRVGAELGAGAQSARQGVRRGVQGVLGWRCCTIVK